MNLYFCVVVCGEDEYTKQYRGVLTGHDTESLLTYRITTSIFYNTEEEALKALEIKLLNAGFVLFNDNVEYLSFNV